MCGAPAQSEAARPAAAPPGVDLGRHTVLQGRVLAGHDGPGIGGAFVRLLDGGGEFTAEVVSSATGDFRFYTAPGTWTVRALHRGGNGTSVVTAAGPGLHEVDVLVA
jgi:hypothetical protein